MAEVVGQGITGGRLDVKSMVRDALDEVVGKELGGVVLPKPRLRISAEEWVQTNSSSNGSGSGGGVDGDTMEQMVASETAAEQVETTSVAKDEEAGVRQQQSR